MSMADRAAQLRVIPEEERPCRWIVVDLETTGYDGGVPVDDPRHRVVQIAAAKFHWDAALPAEFSTVVNPGIWIPAASAAIHGITNARATEPSAMTFGEAFDALVRFCAVGNALGDAALDGHRVGLVAHNMHGFDARVLRAELRRIGRDPDEELDGRFVLGDTLPPFRALYAGLADTAPTRTPFSLGHLHYHVLGVPVEHAHDALGDVRALRRLMVETGVEPEVTPPPPAGDAAPLTALRYVGAVRGARLSDHVRRHAQAGWDDATCKTVGALRAACGGNSARLEDLLRSVANVFDDGQCAAIMRQVLRVGRVELVRPYFHYRHLRLTEPERSHLIAQGVPTRDALRHRFVYGFREDVDAFAAWLVDKCTFSRARARALELRAR